MVRPPRSRDVLVFPDPRLRVVASAVDDVSAVASLVDDMVHTMFLRDAVGLAATQVGEAVRVFVLDARFFVGTGEDPMVFINPEIVAKSPTNERRREGCLSFPGQPVHVVRPSWVTMRALNLRGETFEMCSEGDKLLSLALQHELDHIDAVLMIDRADKRERKRVLGAVGE